MTRTGTSSPGFCFLQRATQRGGHKPLSSVSAALFPRAEGDFVWDQVSGGSSDFPHLSWGLKHSGFRKSSNKALFPSENLNCLFKRPQVREGSRVCSSHLVSWHYLSFLSRLSQQLRTGCQGSQHCQAPNLMRTVSPWATPAFLALLLCSCLHVSPPV